MLTLKDARKSNEVVALADNQLLRSIRDIRNTNIDFAEFDEWCKERDEIRSSPPHILSLCRDALNIIENRIESAQFISDYVTIVVEDNKHYEYIYQNGLRINGKIFRRFSCSAGQARNSTVVLVNEEIADELRRRINNGRDMTKPLAASKFNAYFGLATSATQIVTEPRFIVVPDFTNTNTFMANFVTETGEDEDDIVEDREVTLEMNRADGMGLISPAMSQCWADDLGLDYLPAQWIIRQSFLKGMLCTFDLHQFCEEVNGGNYIVETIYKDADGKPILADLRECDVIVTESMFKLWDSYPDLQTYIDNYHKNKLYWGVARAVPKEDPVALRLNYQFIQTLNLTAADVEELCSQFVDWLQGVSYENQWYMMLFLLGVKNTPERIAEFLRSGDNYWLKSLVANPEIKHDKFVRTKIRELLKQRIHNGCLGQIFVDGNYQMLVSDPYGLMQHVCGLEVTGLLGAGEFYSEYWNKRGVKLVDAMRSPLTYRSEHVLLNLRDDEELRKWYKYCYTGIVLNYHGHEVCNFAGADFDGDILATTNNPVMIRGVYRDEVPVVYDAPKPKKKLLEDHDLYISDTFSFGSIIGEITNKGSNGYALLPILIDRYGIESEEVKITNSRLKQCCKAQSAQIDRTKLGQKVKGIPKIWIKKDTANDPIYSSILLQTKPYFFKYRYRETRKKYDNYVEQNKASCLQRFGVELKDLLKSDSATPEQQEFIANYYHYMPVTYSKSTMNMLCEYIENVDFDISSKIKTIEDSFDYTIYKRRDIAYSTEEYDAVIGYVKHVMKVFSTSAVLNDDSDDERNEEKYKDLTLGERIDTETCEYAASRDVVANILVDYFYGERPKSDKSILWDVCGKTIFKNVKRNSNNKIYFPVNDENGSIEYMGGRYELREVEING